MFKSSSTMLKANRTYTPRVGRSRLQHQLTRTLATVADPPVRRYGGLKDQDRIFTNAFLKHDFGLKGALVRFFPFSTFLETKRVETLTLLVPRRLAQNKRNHLKGRLMDHSNYERFRSTWTRRSRFPQRSQMELHEQAWLGKRPSTTLPRRQR
jgi:hypothetical protein